VSESDGRRPTDVLANERTFLAYLRTAISFIALGFVIARFSLFQREISVVAHIATPNQHASTLLGTAMAIAGVLVGAYGAFRYVASDAALRRGEMSAMPAGAAIGASIVVAVIGVAVAVELSAFQ